MKLYVIFFLKHRQLLAIFLLKPRQLSTVFFLKHRQVYRGWVLFLLKLLFLCCVINDK